MKKYVILSLLSIAGSAGAADNTNRNYIRGLAASQVAAEIQKNCARSGAKVTVVPDATVRSAATWDQQKDPGKHYLCLTGLNGDSLAAPGSTGVANQYCGNDFPGETIDWKNPRRIFGVNLPSQGGLSVESNGRYLLQVLEKAEKPICFVAHSKGAADVLELVRLIELETDSEKAEKLRSKIGCLNMIQPAVWGSPLSDGLLSPGVLGPGSMSVRERTQYMQRHQATICRGLSKLSRVNPSVYASYSTNLSMIERLFQGSTHAGKEIKQFTQAKCKFNDGFVTVDQTLIPCPAVNHYVHTVADSDRGAGHLIQGEPFSVAARFLSSKSDPPGAGRRSGAGRERH